jgi:ribose-phosphate pyrophosphokinase
MVIQEIEKAMEAAARKHIMFMHPHSSVVPGFANIPTDVLYPTFTLARRVEEYHIQNSCPDERDISQGVAGSPDAGAAKLAQVYMSILHMHRIAFGFKTHNGDDQPEILEIAGDVEGRTVVAGDDMVDTGGTTCGFNSVLTKRGAYNIYDVATHAVLAGPCIDRLVDSHAKTHLRRVFLTNSINHEDRALPDFIEIVDIGPLIAEAIWRNFTGGSISEIDGMFPA